MSDIKSEVEHERGALKATVLIGINSIVLICFALIRAKLIALILGVNGIAIYGILHNFFGIIRGLVNQIIYSGTIAKSIRSETSGESGTHPQISLKAFRLFLLVAVLISILCYFSLPQLTYQVIPDMEVAEGSSWFMLGVFFLAIAAYADGRLTSAGRLATRATAYFLSGCLSTVLAIYLVLSYGHSSIVWVILVPVLFDALLTAVLSHRFGLFKLKIGNILPRHLQTDDSARIGLVLAVGGLIPVLSVLLIRYEIVRVLGLEAAGYYQAAYGVSVLYTGIVLNSLVGHYFPELLRVQRKTKDLDSLTSAQITVTLGILAPAAVGVIWMADWILLIIYDRAFVEAADLLQWFAVGDGLKALHWIMSLQLVTYGYFRTYLLIEVATQALYVLTSIFLLESHGLVAVAYIQVLILFFTILVYLQIIRKLGGARLNSGARLIVLTMLLSGIVTLLLVRIDGLLVNVLLGMLLLSWTVWLIQQLMRSKNLTLKL